MVSWLKDPNLRSLATFLFFEAALLLLLENILTAFPYLLPRRSPEISKFCKLNGHALGLTTLKIYEQASYYLAPFLLMRFVLCYYYFCVGRD